MIEVDARGLSCPEPVILTKRAASSNPKELKVFVDNNVSMENVRKFLQKEGYKVTVKDEQGDMVLHGAK